MSKVIDFEASLVNELSKSEKEIDVKYVRWLVQRMTQERYISEMLSGLSPQSFQEVLELVEDKYRVDQLLLEQSAKASEHLSSLPKELGLKSKSTPVKTLHPAEQRLLAAILDDNLFGKVLEDY